MRGTRMKFAMVLLALAMPVTHAAGVCKPELITEVDLYIATDGSVFVPATVSGHEVYFALDIGTGLPMVFDSVLPMLGLAPIRRNSSAEMTWGDKRLTHYAKLDDLAVGAFRMASRNAPVIPVAPGTVPETVNGKPLVGIMGSTLIQFVDSEFVLAEQKLRLFKPATCRNGTPVYWGGVAAALPLHWDQAGTLVFIMELNGKRIEASLFSANGGSTVDAQAAQKFFGIDASADGAVPVIHPMSLTSAGMEIHDAPIHLRRRDNCKLTRSTPIYGAIGYADCVSVVPFSIGTDLLKQLRIYIAVKRDTVFVTRLEGSGSTSGSAVSIAPTQ